MGEYFVNQPFKIRGYWFLPESEDKKVTGELNYSSDGIFLDIVGTLSKLDFGGGLSTQVEHFKIVYGVCENGEIITLSDGFEEHQKNSTITTSRLTFNEMFIGKHISDPKNKTFHSLELRLSLLEEWVTGGVQAITSELSDVANGESIFFKNRIPDLNALKLPTLNSQIKFCQNFKVQSTNLSGTVRLEYWIVLIPNNNMPFSWFENKIHELKSIISFLTNKPTNIQHVEFIDDYNSNQKHIPTKKTRERVTYLPWKEIQQKVEINPIEFSLSLRNILPVAELVFDRWFDEPILSSKRLYIKNLFSDNGDTVNIFSNLTKSMESFHREIFDRKIRKIFFVDRVRELFEQIDARIKNFLFVDDGGAHLAYRVKESRNYYTHYGKKNAAVIEEGFDLFYVNATLKIVLYYHISKYLGISDEVFYQKLVQDWNLQQMLATAKVISMENP